MIGEPKLIAVPVAPGAVFYVLDSLYYRPALRQDDNSFVFLDPKMDMDLFQYV
jgi:hypothetical protein